MTRPVRPPIPVATLPGTSQVRDSEQRTVGQLRAEWAAFRSGNPHDDEAGFDPGEVILDRLHSAERADEARANNPQQR